MHAGADGGAQQSPLQHILSLLAFCYPWFVIAGCIMKEELLMAVLIGEV